MSVLNVKIGVLTKEFETGLARSEKDLQKFSKKINSELSKIGQGFDPFKNLATTAIAAANEIKDALNDLALGTGATGESLQGLKDDFRAVAARVPDSMSASAKAVADLNTMLGISGEDVQKLAVKFLDLSRITKTDLDANISSITRLMNKWGLEVSQGAEIIDKLLVASQSTGVSIDKLAAGVTSQGDALRAMGFSLDESIALFGQLDKLGDDAGGVFKSLNFAMKNFAKEGITDFAAAFRNVFNEIKSSSTLDAAVNKVTEIFGSAKDPAVKLATAIRAGRLEVGDLVGAMNEAGGALDIFTAEAETFADGWARIKNQVSLALEPLGEHILKIASEYLPALSSGVDGVSIDFDDWIIKTGLATAALLTLATGAGAVTAAIGALAGGLASLLTILSGPVGIIAALGGAGLAAAKVIDSLDPMNARVYDAREALNKLSNEVSNMSMDQLRSQLASTQISMRDLANQTYKAREAIAALQVQRAKAIEDNWVHTAFGGETPFTAKYDEQISKESKKINGLRELTKVREKELETIQAQIRALEKTPTTPDLNNTTSTVKGGGIGGKSIGRKSSGGRGGGGIKRSEAETFIQDTSDRIKYYNEDGQKFLSRLNEIQARLKPLSEDWKRLEDLKISINDTTFTNSIQKIEDSIKYLKKDGADFLSDLEALGKPFDALSDKGKRVADIMKNIQDKIYNDRWNNYSWEFSQGLLKASDYAVLLQKEIETLARGSDEWKSRFSELQNIQSELVQLDLDKLNEQFTNGAINNQEYESAIESIKNEFADLPKVIELATAALTRFHSTSGGAFITTQQQLSGALETATKNFKELEGKGILGAANALTSAIVYNEDFGASLKKLGQEIIAETLKFIILKTVINALGMGLGGSSSAGLDFTNYNAWSAAFHNIDGSSKGNVFKFAKGGLVNKPTLFPMKNGLGLMGEVPGKSEAVMPLGRDNQGRLGVYAQQSAANSPTVIVNVENQSSQPVNAKQGITTFDEQFNRAVIQVILRDQATNGPISRNYRR